MNRLAHSSRKVHRFIAFALVLSAIVVAATAAFYASASFHASAAGTTHNRSSSKGNSWQLISATTSMVRSSIQRGASIMTLMVVDKATIVLAKSPSVMILTGYISTNIQDSRNLVGTDSSRPSCQQVVRMDRMNLSLHSYPPMYSRVSSSRGSFHHT